MCGAVPSDCSELLVRMFVLALPLQVFFWALKVSNDVSPFSGGRVGGGLLGVVLPYLLGDICKNVSSRILSFLSPLLMEHSSVFTGMSSILVRLSQA